MVSILGTGLALAVSGSETLERAARPLAVTIQVTPVIAIAPMAMIWAGLDHPERAIIGLAAIVAFFPIFSGALTGLKSADPDLERLFDLYAAPALEPAAASVCACRRRCRSSWRATRSPPARR